MKKYKNLHPIVTLLTLLLSLTNCTTKHTISYFTKEQNYLDLAPDSIYKLLLEKSDSLSLWNKQKQADYWLTRLLAQDKCYIHIKNDSIPKVLEEFYIQNNQPCKAVTAQYLQSTFYMDKGDYPRALKILLKALEQYNLPRQRSIHGHIYSRIGYIYGQTENNLMTKKYYQMAIKAYKNANDSILLPSALSDLAKSYPPTKSDTIFKLFKEAKVLADLQRLHKKVYSINMSLASAYLTADSIKTAYNIIQELKLYTQRNYNCPPKPIQNQYNFLLGKYYIHSEQYERAFEVFKKLSNCENAHTIMTANSILAQLANVRGEYKKANNYYREFLIGYKSLMSQKNLDATQKYQALYDYHVAQEKENQAKQELKQAQLIFSYIAAGITVCVSLIIILIIYAKNRKIQESHKHIKEATNKYLIAQEDILRAENQMSRLKDKHETSQKKLDEQEEEIHRMEQLMLEAKEQVVSILGKKETPEMVLTLHPDYQVLHQDENLKNTFFSDELRDKYMKLVDHFYPNFRQNTLTLYPKISSNDLLLCYLLKLDVPMHQAATHLGRERSTISKARKRIAERSGLDYKSDALEEMIKQS